MNRPISRRMFLQQVEKLGAATLMAFGIGSTNFALGLNGRAEPKLHAKELVESRLTKVQKEKLGRFIEQLNRELDELAFSGHRVDALKGASLGLLVSNFLNHFLDRSSHEAVDTDTSDLAILKRTLLSRTPLSLALIYPHLVHGAHDYNHAPDKTELNNILARALDDISNADLQQERIVDNTASRKLASIIFQSTPKAYLAGLGLSAGLESMKRDKLNKLREIHAELIENKFVEFKPPQGDLRQTKLTDYIPRALRVDGQKFEITRSSPSSPKEDEVIAPRITTLVVEYITSTGNFEIRNAEMPPLIEIPIDGYNQETEGWRDDPGQSLVLRASPQNINNIMPSSRDTISIKVLESPDYDFGPEVPDSGDEIHD